MTKTKTVILVAWDNETEHSLSDSDKKLLADNNIELVYTGIGKVNATRVATDICVTHNLMNLHLGRNTKLHIVNVGCAGSHTYDVRTLIKPDAFIQRDMNASQFGYKQYRTPEEEKWVTGPDGSDPYLYHVVCATGDNANGYSETSDEVRAFDAVDMEAGAIAIVCEHYGAKFTCYKWITDKAAEDSTIEELIENNKLLPWTQIIDEIIARNA